jgi:hypothetical protein
MAIFQQQSIGAAARAVHDLKGEAGISKANSYHSLQTEPEVFLTSPRTRDC